MGRSDVLWVTNGPPKGNSGEAAPEHAKDTLTHDAKPVYALSPPSETFRVSLGLQPSQHDNVRYPMKPDILRARVMLHFEHYMMFVRGCCESPRSFPTARPGTRRDAIFQISTEGTFTCIAIHYVYVLP
jgi:hypothetical protein